MEDKAKQSKKIKFGFFNWAVGFYVVIVISSVMAFGLITFFEFDMGSENSPYATRSIYMIAMIPLMGLAAGIMLQKIINKLRKRMEKILDGINAVAAGDLDVELDLKNAGEYKVIYQNFNKMVSEIKTTKLEMQNFVNDFSHEFKTPITSIKGFAELLLDSDTSEEERNQYLEIIVEESGRLAELSQNTLLLSKLEAEQVITDRTEFALDEQIKKCAIMLFREMEKKQITLNMDLPSVKYYGNPQLMCQIWINLIGNAIKFTPANGEITIAIVKNKNDLVVTVTDGGIGMDEETVKHIFEKYYQGDKSHATKGYGLGLSIVQRIVALCEGKISVSSVPGSGSTFTVTLPED